jgi:hypothetical protein
LNDSVRIPMKPARHSNMKPAYHDQMDLAGEALAVLDLQP